MNDTRGAPEPSTSIVWDWFELHSQQRMQVLGFWLVALGLVTGAYAQLLVANVRLAAAVVAFMGSGVSCLFLLLDRRTRRLIKIAEAEMVEETSTPAGGAKRLLRAADAAPGPTYSSLIAAIESIAAVSLFLLGLYALTGQLPITP